MATVSRIPWFGVGLALGGIVAASAAAGTWEPAAAFPDSTEGRRYAVGLNLGGLLVALGGRPWENGGDQDGAVHSITPGDPAWAVRSPLNGFGPVIHQGAGVDALGRIIVFGGVYANDPGEDSPDPFMYDFDEGDGGFVALRGPAAPQDNFAYCTDSQSRIYSIGGGKGRTASAGSPNSAYVERYDGALDQWTPLAPMPSGVADAAAVDDGRGHIVVMGGWATTGGVRTANVARYDIASNSWDDDALPDMPAALTGLRAVRGADGRIYALGGESGPANAPVVVSSVFVLDLDAGAWIVGPSMMTPRQQFGATLGDDDYIYAMGGSNTGTGTHLVERLYTPPCPVFVEEPGDLAPWRGQTTVLSARATGASPISFQWRRNGAPIVDGPAPGGGQFTGAASADLILFDPAVDDDGVYDVIATNACGDTPSAPVVLAVRTPPAFPTSWTVTNLHPGWALSSWATSVSADQEAGVGTKDVPPYDGMGRPVVWAGSAASAIDLTPAGSVGGQVTAMANGVQVGWWWWPYQCHVGGQWQTCYIRRGAAWTGTAASAVDVYAPGWEYCTLSDTDGVRHTATVSRDDASGNYYSRAGYFEQGSPLSFHSLHPLEGASNSGAGALADGREYGSFNTPFPGPTVHAASWAGAPSTVKDLNPAGASRSWITSAGDGQQVGSAYFNDVAKPSLWADSALSYMDLTSPMFGGGALNDCAGGLQVGAASIGGASHAMLWATSATATQDLHEFVGPNFTSSVAYAIFVGEEGVIRIAGSGFNQATGRTEALLWVAGAVGCPEDLDGDGLVGFTDLNILLGNFNSSGGLPGDIDGDGEVDFADLNALLGLFNLPCPEST